MERNIFYDPEFPDERDVEPIPAPTYTQADLYPTVPDPNCDPNWPLACYWPIYVSNFRLDDLEEDARNAQVANFFASKALLTRMIFVWIPETGYYYRQFQQESMLLDMLVYFTSKEDADRAIRSCHRLSYYGHRLNVWPGRTPVFFDGARSVGFDLPKNCCGEKSETAIEMILRKKRGPIETVARFSLHDVVVEFTNAESVQKAVLNTKYWVPKLLTEPTRKQRFLEQGVESELLRMIADKPEFLDMVPPVEVLQKLLAGQIPELDKSWEHWSEPRELPESTKEKYSAKRDAHKVALRKSNERKRHPEFNVLLDGAPQAAKQPSLRARKAQVKQEVDRILRRESSAPERFRIVLWAKREKYRKLRQKLLELNCHNNVAEAKDLFYKMLAMEEELLDWLPRFEVQLGILRLDVGLTKAVLVADYDLPFPKCITPEYIDEAYEDLPPPSGPSSEIPDHVPTVRPYSLADLNTTQLDPCCDPKWPLANLWPVYVDNFWLNTTNVTRRNEQIHQYFAAKGLLATRIFIHDSHADRYYFWFQKRIWLVDMLVYFTSREDAQKAISLCHRESYYGHFLSVFPGREPVFYDVERSGYLSVFLHKKRNRPDHPTLLPTTYVEENLLEVFPEDVTCITRPRQEHVHFEFVRREQLAAMLPRLALEFNKNSGFLSEPARKQRYLESDMADNIMEKLLGDPQFVGVQPEPELLRALFVGSVPSSLVSWNWVGWNEPREHKLHLKLRESMRRVTAQIMDVLAVWRNMQPQEDQR